MSVNVESINEMEGRYIPVNEPLREILSPLIESKVITFHEKEGIHYIDGYDLVNLFSKGKISREFKYSNEFKTL